MSGGAPQLTSIALQTSHDAQITSHKGLRARLYQQELFEQARQRNVLAFLDTGAGKTLIAVLLIKDKADAIRHGDAKKVTVFLAPKVDLVLQQATVLREHTGLDTRGYVGSMGVDFWKKHDWRKEVARQQVMVMTHQILLNSLRHGFLMMHEINLLIFDECHHAKKNHPYNRIMVEFYREEPKKTRPHIFGMTASPLDTKVKNDTAKIAMFFEELEVNLDSQVVTVADRTQLESVAPLPSTELLFFPNVALQADVKEAIGRMIEAGIKLRSTGDEARRRRHEIALESQGLSKMDIDFDQQKTPTESHIFARHIGSIVHTIEDMGILPGAICLLEVLKPTARSAYKAKLYGQKQEEAGFATQTYDDFDLALDDVLGDSWWDGHNPRQPSARDPCTAEEVVQLNYALWVVVDELQALLNPGAMRLYSALTEHEALKIGWVEVCKRLEAAVDTILGGASWGAVSRQLTGGRQGDGPEPYTLVSSKVASLCQRLIACRDLVKRGTGEAESGEVWTSIIFCKRKFTALALNWLLTHVATLGFLRCAVVMGSGGRMAGSMSLLRRQQAVLADFKAGKLNTLVATAVAEEGLDLTKCRLVVRYDPPTTPLEFIQSRGRARARNSRMVILLEEGNARQLELIQAVHGCEESMRAEAMRRRLRGADVGGSDSEDDDDADAEALCRAENVPPEAQEYRVWATGARVHLAGAKSLLYQYCARLPTDMYTTLQPRFSTLIVDQMYCTRVILPNNAPIQEATGRPMIKKSLAVGSACLEAVKALYRAGGLTDHLLPAAGVQHSGADSYADFDECEVLAAVRDPDMPSRAILRPKWPRALAWPRDRPTALDATAPEDAEFPIHLYRLHLSTDVPSNPKEMSRNARERLPEVQGQQLGLLVPRALPALPRVCMQLVQSLVTHLDVQLLGELRVSAAQYRAAQAWHEALCTEHPSQRVQAMRKRNGREDATDSKGKSKRGPANDSKAAARVLSDGRQAKRQRSSEPHLQQPEERDTIMGRSANDRAEPGSAAERDTSKGAGCQPSSIAPESARACEMPAAAASLPHGSGSQPETDSIERNAELGPMPNGRSCEASKMSPPAHSGAAAILCEGQPAPQSAEASSGDVKMGKESPSTDATAPCDLDAMLNTAERAAREEAGGGDTVAAADATPKKARRRRLGNLEVPFLGGTASDDGAAAWFCVVPLKEVAEAAGAKLQVDDESMLSGPRALSCGEAVTSPSTARAPSSGYGAEQAWEVDWASCQAVTEPTLVSSMLVSAEAAALDTLEAELKGCVVRTTHNSLAYHVLGIDREVTLESPMPEGDTPTWEAKKRARAEARAKAEAAGEGEGEDTGKGTAGMAENAPVAAPQTPEKPSAARAIDSGDVAAADTATAPSPSAAQPPPGRHSPEAEGCQQPDPRGDDSEDKAKRPRTFGDYYRRRYGLADLESTSFMLVCTSKAVQRRQEGIEGREVEYGEATVLLPPQLCLVKPLRQAATQIAPHVPRVLWWVNTLLLAAELREQVSPKDCAQPSLLLMAEALTPGYCHPDLSYERLETLGDAYLKYDCCTHVFHAYPNAHEGQMAERKQAVVSNKNLGILGHCMGLTRYMSLDTDYLDWARGTETMSRRIPHKVVADCVEALIGAHFVAGGEPAASRFMRVIGLLPPMPQKAWELPESDREGSSPLSQKLEAMLGYRFRSLALLKEACTHCSWADQSSACYQRLEFLGDAALDMLITRFYIMGYRDIEPGKLHDLRSASVNNTRLAIIAAWNSLHPFLRYFSPRLFGEIASFAESVREAKQGRWQSLQSRSYTRRMHQFSARDYKGQGMVWIAYKLSTWARTDPADVVYPASARPWREGDPGEEGGPLATGPQRKPSSNAAAVSEAVDGREHPRDRERSRSRGHSDRHDQDRRRASSQEGRTAPHARLQHGSRQRYSGGAQSLGQDALDNILSAGYGIGFAAAPKVLGDLFEAVAGAIFIDSGGSLDVLWHVLKPFLEPMVHPDRVPVHPVRAILELTQKSGTQLTFRRDACADPGCYAMSTVVGGRVIGSCKSAPTRDHARLLAAEAAVGNWSKELVEEIKAANNAAAEAAKAEAAAAAERDAINPKPGGLIAPESPSDQPVAAPAAGDSARVVGGSAGRDAAVSPSAAETGAVASSIRSQADAQDTPGNGSHAQLVDAAGGEATRALISPQEFSPDARSDSGGATTATSAALGALGTAGKRREESDAHGSTPPSTAAETNVKMVVDETRRPSTLGHPDSPATSAALDAPNASGSGQTQAGRGPLTSPLPRPGTSLPNTGEAGRGRAQPKSATSPAPGGALGALRIPKEWLARMQQS